MLAKCTINDITFIFICTLFISNQPKIAFANGKLLG